MRPEAQLFLHVVGAIALFGAFGAVALLGWRGRTSAQAPVLAGATFRTLLLLALPAWVITFVFGNWTKSKEHVADSTAWVGIGSAIAVAGAFVILVSLGGAYAWTRSPGRRGLPAALAGLAVLYVVALGVAWWVMTAKVPT